MTTKSRAEAPRQLGIRVQTTFIVGAGASCCYHLPTGESLRLSATNLEPASMEYQFLIQNGIAVAELNAFLVELRADTTAPSIDAFLIPRHDRKECMRVGRAIIAVLIGQAVSRNRPSPVDPGDDWLGYLFRRMREGARNCQEFLKGNAGVRFVTFNFDTNIEDRLHYELRVMFPNVSGDDVQKARALFKPVHVHGEIQPPPVSPLCEDVLFGFGQEWPHWLQHAQENIHVVMEDIADPVVNAARNAVREASVLCFLGFQYGIDNLERLGLPAVFAESYSPSIYGTAYGLPGGERLMAQRRIPRLQLAESQQKCLALLREHDVLK